MKGLRTPAHLIAWFLLFELVRSASAFAGHGGIDAVTIDPGPPTTIYATMEPATVFKSTDGGANWSRTTLPPPANPAPWKPGHVPALAIDPLNPMRLYVATDYGVFTSTNGGTSWEATSLTNMISTLAIAVDLVTRTTTVYAIRSLAEGGADPRLFKTTDGGMTWRASDFWSTALAVDPVTSTTIYANRLRQYLAGSSAALKSLDGAETWSEIGVPWPWPYGTLTVLAIDPVTPTTLYAGASVDYLCPECESDLYPDLFLLTVPGGAFKSTDGGMSWEAIGLNDVRSFQALAIDPTDTRVIYAGTDAGLLKTTNGGATWLPKDLSTADVRTIAIDPITPDTVYAGTASGVFKSIDGGVTWSATGVMPPAVTAVSAVSLAPPSVVGGGSSTGTVMLNAPAPAGGLVVTLSSGNPPTASVPPAVTVPAGSTTAPFTVTTNPVQNTITFAISATAGGATRSASLTVTAAPVIPPAVSSVSLAPANVIGGGSSTGTVALNAPAPAGGTVVTLSSSNAAAASVPGAVTVPGGNTTATFAVATSPVSTSTAVTISATGGGTTRSAALTLMPPGLSAISMNPSTVQAGTSSTGTVTLSGAAPAGGVIVTLSSNQPGVAAVPSTVIVPAGATSATFSASTSRPKPSSIAVTISAKLADVIKSATLIVTRR